MAKFMVLYHAPASALEQMIEVLEYPAIPGM
jgi:hypothetical protein